MIKQDAQVVVPKCSTNALSTLRVYINARALIGQKKFIGKGGGETRCYPFFSLQFLSGLPSSRNPFASISVVILWNLPSALTTLQMAWGRLVCYTTVFSFVTQRWGRAERDHTKNGCVADLGEISLLENGWAENIVITSLTQV